MKDQGITNSIRDFLLVIMNNHSICHITAYPAIHFQHGLLVMFMVEEKGLQDHHSVGTTNIHINSMAIWLDGRTD